MARRVLIVEDDPSISFMMANVLRLEGFDPTVVSEGVSALEALRSQPYEIVLLDVMLPGMDGISILRSVREDPVLGSIPVVMLTAKVDDESTWAGWKAGCDYYMPKPFDPDELVQILNRFQQAPTS